MNKDNTIRAIFEKHTMPEAGDPELTMFDTDAIIEELDKLAKQREIDNLKRLRTKYTAFIWGPYDPFRIIDEELNTLKDNYGK